MASGTPAQQSLMDSATRFLGWWRDELVGLAPERARRLLADRNEGTVLVQVAGGFQLLTEPARRPHDGSAEVLSRAQAIAALAEMAASRRVDTVGIRVPLSQCFERRLELPKAGRDDLRRMLGFDLERATPFRLAEVYTAHLLAGDATTRGKQRVRQLVVKREIVDTLIADVKGAGLEPAFVDCWQTAPHAGLPVDFLEARDPPPAGLGRHITVPKMLALLVLVLAVLAPMLALSRYEAALEDIRGQTARLRVQAAAVRNAMERSDAAVAGLARLQQMKLEQLPAIELLEELSRLLPDSVWLTDLRIEGGVVDIGGLAKSGAALPSLFVGSALFTDASLTAPVTLDPREDKERFSLRLRIRSPEAARPSATTAGTAKEPS